MENLTRENILNKVDHTLLKQTATWEDIKEVLDDAIANNCASACIPPCYVGEASHYVNGNIPICTVIGFPNGYMSTTAKIAETKQAIEDGANEIDMVINIGWLKAGHYGKIGSEILEIAKVCHNEHNNVILKVIIETCLLTEKEIRGMCSVVANWGADFIKTSTGFSTNGATPEVIRIMKEELDILNNNNELKEEYKISYPYRDRVKIKAAGGIKNFEDAEMFLKLGADRLGTSRLISN